MVLLSDNIQMPKTKETKVFSPINLTICFRSFEVHRKKDCLLYIIQLIPHSQMHLKSSLYSFNFPHLTDTFALEKNIFLLKPLSLISLLCGHLDQLIFPLDLQQGLSSILTLEHLMNCLVYYKKESFKF